MWGGRFERPMDPRLDRMNRSLPVDRRLWREDLDTNRAWTWALEGCGVLTADERARMLEGLDAVARQLAAGAAAGADDEDIHSLVERLLGEAIGALAGKLHTGRSRNDQLGTDLRLWTMRALDELDALVAALGRALIARARTGVEIIMASYTHTQRAQPVRFAHWALAHAWPLARDRARLAGARTRAAVLPLGSAAIAGSGFPVDRAALARRLGFDAVTPNSIDAVGDRDFALEACFAATVLSVHLSRLAEDLVLYSTSEFGFLALPEPFTTGSSLMPQKRNPDALELVRGKAGHQIGRLTATLTTLKGLPAGYQKDLQENNDALITTLDTARDALGVMTGVVDGLVLHTERMRAAVDDSTLATDVADLLVQGGMPFREAHAAVGALVRAAERRGVTLREVPAADAAAIAAALPAAVAALSGPEASVERRALEGGTARAAVERQLLDAEVRFAPGSRALP